MINAVTYSHLIRALMDGECTRAELSRITGLHCETVSRYVTQLHRRRVVWIADWKKNPVNGNWCPRYALNVHDMKDTPKPAAVDRATIDRQYRGRKQMKMINAMMAGRFA